MNRTNAGRHNDSGQNLTKLPAAKPETDFYLQVRDGYKPTRMGICKACHKVTVRRRAVNRQEQKKRERLL